MTGTGSFMKPCRTLFVGGLLKHKYDPPQTMEEALWKNFGEWGEVEHINVIYRLSIAFVRYRVRTSAGIDCHMVLSYVMSYVMSYSIK